MIHGTKKWSTLTAAVLLSLSSLALPQTTWAAGIQDGSEAKAHDNSIAIGNSANASEYENAIAIGNNTKAGDSSCAYGGTGTTAVGYQAQALAMNSVALGISASVHGVYGVALGDSAEAWGGWSTALGWKSFASGQGSIAIGHSWANGTSAIAIGGNNSDSAIATYATDENAVAIGNGANASKKNTISLGAATASAENAIAIGNGANASANAVALGQGSVANEAGTVSLGKAETESEAEVTRRIVHVADGKDSSDAATYGQIAKTGLEVKLSTGERADGSGKNNEIVTNDGTVLATFTKMASVANDDYGFVSGADLYNETRSLTSTNYIDASNTTGANLSSLDKAIGTVDDNYTFIKKSKSADTTATDISIAQNLINLDTGITKLISYDKDSSTLKIGSGDDIAADTVSFYAKDGATTRKLMGITYGGDNNDAAAYGQLIKADTYNATSSSSSDVQTATLAYNDETSNTAKVKISIAGEGAVADGDVRLVNGDTVYEAIANAKTALTLSGSDSITIADNTIRVKNMAQSDSETEVTNGETKASGANALALGYTAKAFGRGALTVGYDSTVQGNHSAAIGYMNHVWERDAYAFGQSNTVSAYESSAVGLSNKVYATQSVAVGNSNILGYETVTTGTNIYTFGSNNTVTGSNSFVIGTANTVDAENTFVFGSGVTVHPTATNSVVLGNNSSVEDANTVSVGSDTSQRKIVHVADGTKSSDAATYGQIAKTGLEVKLSTGERADGSGKNNEIVTNDGTVLATFTKMTSVANDDYGFVSGADLYKETREGITSTNYISQNSSTGANLNALDTAIGAKTSVTDLYTADDSVETQMHSVGSKTIKSMSNAVSEDASQAQKITVATYDNENAYSIEIAGQGSVQANDKRLVNGGTVWSNLVQNKEYEFDRNGNVTIQTNDNGTAFTLKLAAATGGSIETGNSGFVTGGAVYQYLSPESNGNYIKTGADNTTAANLSALDKAIGKVDKDYTFIQQTEKEISYPSGGWGYTTVTVFTSLADNLIKLDQGITKLISYSDSTLHIGAGEGINTDTVSFLANDRTTTRKLTGISNGSANTDAAAYGQLIAGGDYSISSTDSNQVQKVELKSNDGTSKVSISIAGDGSVASGDKRLVDGGTVYTAIEKAKTDLSTDISGIQTNITAEDGSYVKKDNSAGANLNALDEAIGTVTKGNVIEASLDENGALKTSVAANLKLIDDKIGTIADKEGGYKAIDKDATISANLVALDEKLKEVSTDTTADLTDIEKKTKYKEAKADGESAIGLGKDSNASGSDSISLGTSAEASDANTVALGNTAKATKANATALGNKAEASGASAVALGDSSKASGSDAVSLGTGAEASGASALAMGKGANASKENALAFGTGAAASADGAAALGNGATAEGSNAISFGTGAAASKENALAFGNGAKASEKNTLAFGNGATASSENAMAFGNGASATGSGSVAIGSGSTASEDNVVSFGAAGSERRLTNVAAGVNDTDAVNVGQMNSAIGENFNYLKSSLTRDINKVAAGSAALAALRPEGFDPDDKFSMAVGFGHYKSANAGAIGAFYKPNYDTTFSIGATLGDGETIMNMGVSFKLGSRGKRLPQTGAALSQEVASLRENNEALKKDNASQATAIEEQAKEIADLKADNERMKADNERMKEQIAMILSKMELSEKVEKTMVKAG